MYEDEHDHLIEQYGYFQTSFIEQFHEGKIKTFKVSNVIFSMMNNL